MILVAGATGLVGRATVEVVQSGRRPWTELSRGARHDLASDVGPRTLVACDVTDAAALVRAVPKVRSILHLAGIAPGARPGRADHELAAMRALLELGRAREVERFVFLSATGASTDASHPWLRAKGAAEQLLRASGLPFVVLRAGLVTSPDSPALNALRQVVLAGLLVRLPLLRAGRLLPVAAGDVAIALATALDHHRMVGETLELGTPPELSLDDLIALIARRLSKEAALTRMPMRGTALAAALAAVPVAPLPDAESFLRLFAVSEPQSVALYDRLIPMRRTPFVEELRGFPWGAPAPRPGEPLPTIAPPTPGLPLFVPGEAMRDAARLGRTDPFGRVEGGERSAHDDSEES